MSKILSNEQLSQDFFLMRVEHENTAQMGQFYMMRAWDKYPVLSRPISVYDTDRDTISFLYKVVGEGTEIFSKLEAGDDITLQGPLGNTVPDFTGKIALVGGGVGIAPLYLAAKQLKRQAPDCTIDIFLGFSDSVILEEEYREICDNLKVNLGGFVTDDISPQDYDHIFTCGPEIMMEVLYNKCKENGVGDRLYVSMENRMACGVGACLVCTCKTTDGNKKACKDGPIFKGEAVFEVE